LCSFAGFFSLFRYALFYLSNISVDILEKKIQRGNYSRKHKLLKAHKHLERKAFSRVFLHGANIASRYRIEVKKGTVMDSKIKFC
jgi:hypothetical protein